MTVTANRNIDVSFSGDLESSTTYSAAVNTDSPAQIEIKTLSPGNNDILVPDGAGGGKARCCTIVKPVGNTIAITLKGVDENTSVVDATGIILHATDPDSLTIDSTVAGFVLSVASEIVGVRLIWT